MNVHVIARGRGGVLTALRRARPEDCRVVHWDGGPPPSSHVRPGDCVVIDISDPPANTMCGQVLAFLPRAAVFAIVGPGTVSSRWVSLAANSAVRVVMCDAGASGDEYSAAISTLEVALKGPSPDELAEFLTSRDDRLRGLRDLVALICRQPWDVRRLADLVALTGFRRQGIVARCRAAGFVRVEHFLCVVRVAGHEALVERFGVVPAHAWWRVGVSDSSNFRRQVARAHGTSQ